MGCVSRRSQCPFALLSIPNFLKILALNQSPASIAVKNQTGTTMLRQCVAIRTHTLSLSKASSSDPFRRSHVALGCANHLIVACMFRQSDQRTQKPVKLLRIFSDCAHSMPRIFATDDMKMTARRWRLERGGLCRILDRRRSSCCTLKLGMWCWMDYS